MDPEKQALHVEIERKSMRIVELERENRRSQRALWQLAHEVQEGIENCRSVANDPALLPGATETERRLIGIAAGIVAIRLEGALQEAAKTAAPRKETP